MYQDLATITDQSDRERKHDEIDALNNSMKTQQEEINRQIYEISMNENIIEREVKRKETEVTALKQQLEAIQQAEGWGIQNATPKFGGLG